MSIISHDADTRVVSSRPGFGCWVPFFHVPSFTFYGECQDDDCGRPWSLNLETRELRQCGCPGFLPGEPFLPEVADVLVRLDRTPKPRRARWVFLGCEDSGDCFGGGAIGLDTVSGEFIPCHRCGWSPADQAPEWQYTA